MVSVTNRTCTGCRACEQLCPKGCIRIEYDDEGFLLPIVDKNECINCGICEKRCPQINPVKNNSMNTAYAFQMFDSQKLVESTSGGAATAISEYIFSLGGVVVGSAYDENYYVRHVIINKGEEATIQGSKYVQSDTVDTFSRIKELLEKFEKPVFFIGTPCQVAGLKAFLNKDYKWLYTADIICHGVPSPLFFEKYLSEKSGKQPIDKYVFRDKTISNWGDDYKGSITVKGKKKVCDSYRDSFYYAFMSCQSLRECCYECKYASIQRVGDITLGDWWGKRRPEGVFDYKAGVSVILMNTAKGDELIKGLSGRGKILQLQMEDAIDGQHNLKASVSRPTSRDGFYTNILDLDGADFMKLKAVPYVNYVKALIPNKLRRMLRK